MKYKAMRPFYGDGGMVRRGSVLELDEARARELGPLVQKVEETRAEPVPDNKMEVSPPNKAARKPKVTKEGTGI